MWVLRKLEHQISKCHPQRSAKFRSSSTAAGSTATAELVVPVSAMTEHRCNVAPSGGGGGCCLDGLREAVCGRHEGLSDRSDQQQQQQQQPLEDRCRSISCDWCRSLCIQIILVVVNFFFLVLGWALIAFGIWLHLNHDAMLYNQLMEGNPNNPGGGLLGFDKFPFILVCIGVFLAAMSFLGCCGASAENVCFLGFYTFLLVIIMAAEVLLGSLSSVISEQMSRQMSRGMLFQLDNEYNKTAQWTNVTSTDTYKVTLAWDTVQANFNCCGVKGPNDYQRSSWYNNSQDVDGLFVPPSCCVPHQANDDPVTTENYCQIDAILFPNKNTSLYLNTRGCHTVLVRWLYGYASHAFLLLTIFVSIQFIDLVLACSLMNWVRKKQAESWWWETSDYD